MVPFQHVPSLRTASRARGTIFGVPSRKVVQRMPVVGKALADLGRKVLILAVTSALQPMSRRQRKITASS
jgi:hypothetical protein